MASLGSALGDTPAVSRARINRLIAALLVSSAELDVDEERPNLVRKDKIVEEETQTMRCAESASMSGLA